MKMWNRIVRRVVATLAIVVLVAFASEVEAGPLGKALMRGAARSSKGSMSAKLKAALAADARRDALRRPVPLLKTRNFFRYATAKGSASERRLGIPARRHLTSDARPGRPLRGAHATKDYATVAPVRIRELVQVQKGTLVKPGKVMGGAPGKGEFRTVRRLPPSAIKRVVKLR
jgi:hypothetical protein